MKFTKTLVAFAITSSVAVAAPYQFNGHTQVTVPVSSGDNAQKQYVLPKVSLPTAQKRQAIATLKQQNRTAFTANFGEVPPHHQIGMEGTPVLDQGMHGSCVTFAATAAVDALLGAGDYVSQLCNLELGSYLAINDKSEYSGWEGAYGSDVLGQIQLYGVVSQNHQKLHGCAGVRTYNLHDPEDQGHPMSEEEFAKVSIPLDGIMDVTSLMNEYDASWWKVLNIRQALAKGNRVVVGMALDVNVDHHVGAVGQMHVPGDTWMLTPQISDDYLNDPEFAGHEMVITGYDDNAEVMDSEGHVNRGVFTLRNSWSQYAGDQGNYYVSYDYFRLMGLEANEISLVK